MIIIIWIFFYCCSCLLCYFGIRKRYQTNWKVLTPGWFEILITFTPFINTVWGVLTWLIILIESESKKDFFNLKK